MFIVRFIGGLGNQMFQYSFYKYLESRGVSVKADVNDFKNYKLHNGFELERVFNIRLNKASYNEINKYKDSKLNLFYRIRRKLFGQKKSHQYQSSFSFQTLDEKLNMYLDGYWQAEKFISPNIKSIQQNFIFKSLPSIINAEIIKKMEATNSISIHVRRGDYLDLKDVYSECTALYYQKAIAFFEKQYKHSNFYIFSNDINWCKENLIFKNSTSNFVVHNSGLNSFEDIRLMNECKHNIIANSSFSWWGAFLNRRENKEVICPEFWFVDIKKNKDVFIPREWKIISN